MTLLPTPSLLLTGVEAGWILASYVLGCFTAGYYLTRWKTGRDIRALGSGGVGARNVGRALGRGGFGVTFLLDAAKGALAVLGAVWIGLGPEAVAACIVAVVAGHNWPVQLRFRGGKGVAVSLGALIAYDPFIVLALVVIVLPIIVVLRSVTLSGMIGFALAPLFPLISRAPVAEVVAVSIVAVMVVLSHRTNIRQEIARIGWGRPVEETSP